MSETLFETGSAVISPCGLYRSRLERVIGGDGPVAAILGVNPSTADATVNDATIRKDMGFARRHGWSRIIKGNKFEYRATDVKVLRTVADPVGPDADAHLASIMRDADVVVAAWGPLAKLPPQLRTRWRRVVKIANEVGCDLMCFGTAQDGQPLHTLMLSYETPLIRWERPT